MKAYRDGLIAVILDDGEDVHEGVGRACRDAGTDSAMILSGIGMVRSVKLGFWNGREYEIERYAAPMELLSLSGSIAAQEGKTSVHIHACLAGRDHKSMGGHLVSADANNINEITLAPYGPGAFLREFSSATGLNMLNFAERGQLDSGAKGI